MIARFFQQYTWLSIIVGWIILLSYDIFSILWLIISGIITWNTYIHWAIGFGGGAAKAETTPPVQISIDLVVLIILFLLVKGGARYWQIDRKNLATPIMFALLLIICALNLLISGHALFGSSCPLFSRPCFLR